MFANNFYICVIRIEDNLNQGTMFRDLFHFISIAVLCVGILSACDKKAYLSIDEFTTTGSIENKTDDGANLCFGTAAGDFYISVSTNKEWTAHLINDRADDWISISTSSGSGEGSIRCILKENTGYDERSASIVISVEGFTKTVRVTQKQKDALLVSASKVEFGAEGGNFTIEVKHNITYTLTVDPSCASWIRSASTKAMSTDALPFTVDPNSSVNKREGKIYVESAMGKETVTIYQAGDNPELIQSQILYTVADEGGVIDVDVISDATINVDIKCDWIKEVITKSMSTDKYTFEILANEDIDEREGVIEFTCLENGRSETVTVQQLPKEALVVDGTRYQISVLGGIIEVPVGHNYDYTVDIDQDWVTLVETKSYSVDTLVLNVDSNPMWNTRKATVTITSESKELSRSVIIEQVSVATGIAEVDFTFFNDIEDKESITECNFYVGSDKKTDYVMPSRYSSARIYMERVGTVINFYTSPMSYHINPYTDTWFEGWSSLKKLDLTTWNTSDADMMDNMFKNCSSLESVDLSSFDTKNVKRMSSMFEGCSSLKSIDLSNFDTSNVNSMSFMFSNCTSLESVDLSSFNTSNVENFMCMFQMCSSLKSVDLSNFDTSNALYIGHMLKGCSSLESIDLSNFNTSKVENMDSLFENCTSLRTIDIRNFDLSGVKDRFMMLYNSGGSDPCKIICNTVTYNILKDDAGANIIWEIVD